MEKLRSTFSKPPKHLSMEEYEDILSFVERATDGEISTFLDIIKVKFSGGNKGIDREQVMFVVDSDTNIPEIKQKMIEFIRTH